ncbi:MAG: formylglycine-generating enzyme family protein, partial [Pseudomonadota bacterium]
YGPYASQVSHTVAEKRPNQFELYDLHGNAWEWSQDYWDRQAYRRRWDGITPAEAYKLTETHGDKSTRMLRGGAWISGPEDCRATYRFRMTSRDSLNNFSFGLRVCLAPSLDQSISCDA